MLELKVYTCSWKPRNPSPEVPRYKDTFPLSLFMYGGMETWPGVFGSGSGLRHLLPGKKFWPFG